MNPILLLAPPPGATEGGSPFAMPLMFGILFVIMYFLIIRPQQQQQKKHEALIKGVKKGDRVLTSGGIWGRVTGTQDDRVILQIAKDVNVELQRTAIATVVGSESKE